MEQYHWGIPVAIDLFTAGLGAAMFMVAAVANLADEKKYRRISTAGALWAPFLVLLGVILLIIDLGRPLRFWEMILRRSHETLGVRSLMLNVGSTMSVGTWLLTIFVIFGFIYLVAAIIAWFYDWAKSLQRFLSVVGLPIALGVATYTGVLISASSNPLWSNWLLVVVFVASALVTGVAGITFTLACIRLFKPKSKIGENVPLLENINSRLIVINLVVIALFLIIGLIFESSRSRTIAIIGPAFGVLWWIGIIGLCLVVPFFLTFKNGAKNTTMSVIVSALILLGGFFLRYVILIGGQLVV